MRIEIIIINNTIQIYKNDIKIFEKSLEDNNKIDTNITLIDKKININLCKE
jgi:hypothetical protein